jgi:PKD repeat protein
VTTQDFYLEPAPSGLVYGWVTDANTGWPLYASINIAGYPDNPVWTDPETGYYEVLLPQSSIYNFQVEAWVAGYLPLNVDVGPVMGDMEASFALDADLAACIAPGYQKTYDFFDDFENGYGNWIGTGLWNAENEADACGSLVAPFPSSSNAVYYGQDGICTYDTGSANSGELTMVSPVTLPGYGGSLEFASYEETECGGDCGYDNRYVEISDDGGANWDLLGEGDTEGTWYLKGFDLSAYGGDDVLFRFRFDTIDSVGNAYFGWMVDNVAVATGCEPQAGGLVVGNVYHENTLDPLVGAKVANDTGGEAYALPTPADPNVDDAFYTLFSPPGDHLFTASFVPPYGTDDETVTVVDGDTVGQDFFLPAPHLVLDPEELEVWVLYETPVYTHPAGLDLINDGGLPLDFELVEISGTTTLLLGESQVTVPAAAAEAPAGTAVTLEGASSPDVLFQPAEPRITMQSILYIATTDTSQSVERALNELGYAYDYIYGTDWTGIDFSPYDVVIVGMDGGGMTVASIAKVRTDVIDQGKRLIFLGGTCWYDFADGVNQYLVLNDTGDYCWTISGTPHFTVVDPGHPLAQGLPPSYDFINSSAAYYQMRATDPDLEVVAVNGDGYDDLFYKNMNFPLGRGGPTQGGDMIWFINSVYSSYWTNQADFDVLKQIVSNSITFSGAGGDVPWFWEVPVSGTVPANDVQNVAVGFTALYSDLTPMPLGDYYATLWVGTNDPVSDTQHVPVIMHIVEEYITPTASFECNSPVCLGETTVFTNTTIPGVPPKNAEGQVLETTCLWDFGDGETSTEFEPTHVYTEPGTYDVTLEACSPAGMCDTFEDTVEVLPLPVAGFSYEVAGFEVTFTNTSLDALSYKWDFDDGMGSTDENPVHTYAAADTYTVILTATNDCAIDVYSAEVEVIGLSYYYLPLIHKNYE